MDYDLIVMKTLERVSKNYYYIIRGWKYTTSGILVHYVGLEWDEEVILIFPLIGLREGTGRTKQRHELETGIGNYLITKDVPIIDYYSHRI